MDTIHQKIKGVFTPSSFNPFKRSRSGSACICEQTMWSQTPLKGPKSESYSDHLQRWSEYGSFVGPFVVRYLLDMRKQWDPGPLCVSFRHVYLEVETCAGWIFQSRSRKILSRACLLPPKYILSGPAPARDIHVLFQSPHKSNLGYIDFFLYIEEIYMKWFCNIS